MRKNLLVVSDSGNFHIIIEAIFKERHSVFFAADENDAFPLLSKLAINLIILAPGAKKADVFLERLRAGKYGKTPVLMAGALITPEIIANAHKYGVSDIVKLPFEPIGFERKVDELLIKFSPPRERPDPVTGLPKRLLGEARVAQLLKDGKKGALMLIDLDYYSFLSSAVSDETLVTCRDAILAQIKQQTKTDTEKALLSAVKGGGFLLFVPGLRDREKTQEYANLLIDKILEKSRETVFVSIGLAVSDRHGKNYSDLHKACDKGLGEARKNGKNAAKFYEW